MDTLTAKYTAEGKESIAISDEDDSALAVADLTALAQQLRSLLKLKEAGNRCSTCTFPLQPLSFLVLGLSFIARTNIVLHIPANALLADQLHTSGICNSKKHVLENLVNICVQVPVLKCKFLENVCIKSTLGLAECSIRLDELQGH